MDDANFAAGVIKIPFDDLVLEAGFAEGLLTLSQVDVRLLGGEARLLRAQKQLRAEPRSSPREYE